MDDDVGTAVRHGRQAAALAESEAGADVYVAALAALAGALYMAGEIDGASEAAQKAVRHVDGEHQGVERMEAWSTLALVAVERGHAAAARSYANEARNLARKIGVRDSWTGGSAAAAQAAMLASEGKLREAEREAEHAARMRRSAEASAQQAWALILLASIQARRGRLTRAEEALDAAGEMIGEMRNAGRLPVLAAEAAALLVQTTRRAEAGSLRESLTPAELEILGLLATDLSQREIGAQLFLSVNTIKTHARNVYRKLGASSREDAVGRAAAAGLLDSAASERLA
jgi:LuxR family maltose regulon positive regulatory protein